MHDFTEKAKRGGIAMAGHRFLKANNPKMGDSFNPSKPTTWISYVDANNLYGWAMSQCCPWLLPKYQSALPLKTHDYLQDLPPAVDNGGRFPETEKLVPHLGKHEDYVIHYQELQYYIKLGMVVDEITQVLSFDQDNWLAPYIAKIQIYVNNPRIH
ncbi:unnamed protein product [Rhizophagus irregularis]|nr:unnamed protein product [Rhizophagus irregularis]